MFIFYIVNLTAELHCFTISWPSRSNGVPWMKQHRRSFPFLSYYAIAYNNTVSILSRPTWFSHLSIALKLLRRQGWEFNCGLHGRQSRIEVHTLENVRSCTHQTLMTVWYFPACAVIVPCLSSPDSLWDLVRRGWSYQLVSITQIITFEWRFYVKVRLSISTNRTCHWYIVSKKGQTTLNGWHLPTLVSYMHIP